MGNNDSTDASIFKGFNEVQHPVGSGRSSNISVVTPISYIDPNSEPTGQRLDNLAQNIISSPLERGSKKFSLSSMPSLMDRPSMKCSFTDSPIHFSPSTSKFSEGVVSARPSEEAQNATERLERPSEFIPNKRRKRKKSRSKAGPTMPRAGPTTPSIPQKKNKITRPGPTRPGPTAPVSDDESSECSTSSHSSGSSMDKIDCYEKKDMHNWTDGWKGVKRVRGLYVDEKSSDTITPIIIHNFLKQKSAEEDDLERSASPGTTSRTSVRSGISVLSVLSDGSPISRARSKSVLSDVSSMSDMSHGSQSVNVQTFSDLMPKAAWASPHYRDYEEEPYDPYKLSRTRKTRRSEKTGVVSAFSSGMPPPSQIKRV